MPCEPSLDSPPEDCTDDAPHQEAQEEIRVRKHATDVFPGMLGSVALQGPPPQRGDAQRGTSPPAEEAAEDNHLNPQKITHWLSAAEHCSFGVI
jgi:hypothetical protein